MLRCGAGGTNAGFEVPFPAVMAPESRGIACEKSCSSRQTVQCSSSWCGSGCTLRYDGGSLVGSSCEDVGALLGMSG
jgi:hypothetical protein